MFPMMFYRNDILEDLEVAPPETWDDFIRAIAVLNRAYLEMGLLPPTANLSSTIFEPGDTFTMLQLQTGNNFYVQNDDGIYYKTTFDQESSIQAFTTWTRFYTVYQFDQTFDPFSRFRTGEMPIVILPYGFYNQVAAAAPEIRGLWDFRHVPGTWRTLEEGQSWGNVPEERRRITTDNRGNEIREILDISASSAASCGLIFNKTKDKDAAWDFLKWLTSDEIQTQFGQNMEAMLGPMGRYDTANKNALANLAWSPRELRRLETQRDALVEIPMIPANYSATRHIKNAFRAVVNDNWFPRYALESYNRDIDAEITRKNNELASHQR
jgi:ABC-type glycerol-3-phosphate transport system substrate-binding protein